MKYILFIGRWSPFHNGHKYIIDSYVNNGKPVCIAIRDTELSKSDPFSAITRKKMIENIYKDNSLVKVIIIPDIETVAVGRQVGYSIIEVPEEIKTISATKIRSNQSNEVSIEAKTALNKGKGLCVWFTGLPCSGKTTIANRIKSYLTSINRDVEQLDGDIIRKSLSKDLGFSKEDRTENLKRVANVAKTLVDFGAITLCSFVSPYENIRQEVYDIIGKDRVIEIYVKCSSEECSKRDVKGMWAKAKNGEIKGFTGFDASYEEPINPDLIINTEEEKEDGSIDKVVKFLYNKV